MSKVKATIIRKIPHYKWDDVYAMWFFYFLGVLCLMNFRFDTTGFDVAHALGNILMLAVGILLTGVFLVMAVESQIQGNPKMIEKKEEVIIDEKHIIVEKIQTKKNGKSKK